MKTKIFLLFLLFLIKNISANYTENEKELIAFMSYSSFYSHQQGPYIETYISVLGNSVSFIEVEDGKFRATVEITILIKKNDSIIDFNKINLNSPVIEDTSEVDITFSDVQRYALANGEYELEITVKDIYSKSIFAKNEISQTINLNYPENKVNISGIELVENFSKTETPTIISKAGYDLIPLPINFYPSHINNLSFYVEIYNTDRILGEDGMFLIKSYIKQYETNRIVNNTFKRENTKPHTSYLHQFDISDIPSGNYFLIIEVINKENKIITDNKLFFQRSKPELISEDFSSIIIEDTIVGFVARYTNRDSLAEHISSLRPVASGIEKNFIDNQTKTATLETLQKFFCNFWQQRSNNPENEWNEYARQVQKVDNAFGTLIKKGYQTDRGRVYLQYGAPNTIVSEIHDPSSYPYEIWHFYTLNNQSNRKFVFYNRDLVTNDYELLHSDAIGEIQDYQWQLKLNQRIFTTRDPDMRDGNFGWGSKVRDYWNNPR